MSSSADDADEWRIGQTIIDLAADRGAYIDQSQSLNIHLNSPTFGQLTSVGTFCRGRDRMADSDYGSQMHFYAWKKGLKTGMYYLRTRAAAAAIQFTVDKKLQDEAKAANKAAKATPATPLPVSSPAPTDTASSSVTSSPVIVPSAGASPLATATAGMAKMALNGTGAGAASTPPAIKAKWSGPAAGSTPSPLAQRIAALNAANAAQPSSSPVLSSSSSSAGASGVGSENEGLTFEEAKARAAERQLEAEKAALGLDDGEGCLMCSG